MVRILVSDTGDGMPPEVVRRVFDPFYTRRSGGTGLGLAISQQIIEDHQGHIQVSSVEGGGTTFEIVLPVLDSEPEVEVISMGDHSLEDGRESMGG